MKNSGVAVGLAAIGVGLTTIGINMNGGGSAAHAKASAVQGTEPTIVWYGASAYGYNASGTGYQDFTVIARAWSDGTVELRRVRHSTNNCGAAPSCIEPWQVVNAPIAGLNAAADINFDELVDGEDLAMLLTKWGDAPRSTVPPSDCPLALINP